MNAFSNETCLNVKHQHIIFQHIVQIYLNTYWHTPVRPYKRLLHQSLKQLIGQVFSHQQRFLATSKLLTPNMYCWSCKTLVTIYCTYLRVNGIWAKFFCPQKMNNRTMFLLRDAFSSSVAIFIVHKWRHSDVIVIKITALIKNKIMYKDYISDFSCFEN